MYADYHLHCEYSDDSNEPMENQIRQAIASDLDEMCFTDHVDYGIKRDWDDPEGIIIRHAVEHGKEVDLVLANVNYPKYFAALNMYQKKYASSISIKKGLEFGIQSITVDAYEKLYASYQDDLDFVLFSMHQVNNLEFWTQDFQKGKIQKEYNDEYYIPEFGNLQWADCVARQVTVAASNRAVGVVPAADADVSSLFLSGTFGSTGTLR